jgi:hypothetical protein
MLGLDHIFAFKRSPAMAYCSELWIEVVNMPVSLSSEQIVQYQQDGFLCPLDCLDEYQLDQVAVLMRESA